MHVDIITRNVAKANRLLANMNIAGSVRNPRTKLVISDSHTGLESAVRQSFTGVSW